ncbi:MAG: oligosaccharide repeat unit polymerase, partial [Proteobacteria bacterium]|nr:oligosaccharide repeat unit polymerase [Pseudomonadota bacterium]
SLENYILMTHAFSVARYAEDYAPPPLITQLFLIGVFSSPILGGIIFAVRRSKLDLCLSLLSILPALLIFATQTTRSAFSLAFILWASGYFSCVVLLHGRSVRLFTKKVRFLLLGLVLLVVILFSVGQILREGGTPDIGTISDVLASPNTRASIFGHISVFSQWFVEEWYNPKGPTFGAFSVAGVFDILGIHKRDAGLYINQIIEVEPGASTNIYTTFRGLISDFTLVGSLIFLYVVGIITGWAYYRVGKGALHFMPILIAFYAFATGHGVSIFNYNSILFGWLMVSIYIWRIRVNRKLLLSTNVDSLT